MRVPAAFDLPGIVLEGEIAWLQFFILKLLADTWFRSEAIEDSRPICLGLPRADEGLFIDVAPKIRELNSRLD